MRAMKSWRRWQCAHAALLVVVSLTLPCCSLKVGLHDSGLGQVPAVRWRDKQAIVDPEGGTVDPTDVRTSQGGSLKTTIWQKDPAGLGAYLAAMIWCSLIASLPIALHIAENGVSYKFSKVQLTQSIVLYIWLIGGLYLFTNVLLFQSPHFDGKIRSLSLIEAVYLFSQIITTVGYGDITPAKLRGQVFVGIFVVMSFLVVAGMISQGAALALEKIRKQMRRNRHSHSEEGQEMTKLERQSAVIIAAKPLMQSSAVFAVFLVIGVIFFSQYPGEGKTVPQAIYMSLITLSSVGFGAFTPVTRAGMVFGAFWMVFGVSSLAAVVSSMTAFVAALKRWEQETEESEGNNQ